MKTKTFNVYIQENQAVQDAYAMLTANIHMNNEDGALKSIALTSYKPSMGKTTLAINLAITMAVSGWKVLLIDADIRKPVEAKRLNNDDIEGFSDYLAGEAELKDILCTTNVKNFSYISFGENHPNPIGLLCSARFKEFTQSVRNEYDFILFDTPALSSVVDASMIAAKSDATLIVAQLGEESITTLKKAKEQLENSNANILGVVLNKLKKRDYKGYFESYNYFSNAKNFVNKKNKK